MPKIIVASMNHLSFTVVDLDRTVDFFHQGCGFEILNKGPRASDMAEKVTGVPGADILVAFLRGPGFVMELIEYLAPEGRKVAQSRPCDAGFSHLALNVDDFEAAIDGAEAYGLIPMGETCMVDRGPNKGRRIVYMQTWDNITVELMENTPTGLSA